jgi:hypothetical protein
VPMAVHVGFVVDKVAWDRFPSESFGFTLSISVHRSFTFTHALYREWTMGLLAAAVLQTHSLTPS